MACFLVPTVEAIVTTIVTKVIKSKDKKPETSDKIPFSGKLKWLSNLLLGGSVLLAFEHLWHGEIVPWFPFLTAANDPADTAEMLHEMATTGVTMAVLITVIWIGMIIVASVIEKRSVNGQLTSE